VKHRPEAWVGQPSNEYPQCAPPRAFQRPIRRGGKAHFGTQVAVNLTEREGRLYISMSQKPTSTTVEVDITDIRAQNVSSVRDEIDISRG